MTSDETRATLAMSLLAAYADGSKHSREREEIRRIAEGLAGDGGIGLPALYQDVLMKRVTLQTEAPRLLSPESRQLAFEMAVCVCDADGSQSEAERVFLADLARALGLEPGGATAFSAEAEAVAAAAAVSAATATAPGAVRSLITAEEDTELDRAILNAAILNGALELLPESLSTLAIIPLQLKLVHRVGKAYGYELDAGHVAKRYYAGGRVLSTQMLREAYADVSTKAQSLQSRHWPEIQQRARGLDAAQVLSLVRGN